MWVIWAAWALASTAPYLWAPRQAPPGRAFTGILFYQNDVYMYLSFVEQASHGRVIFHNKFDPRPSRPLIVNVEWWLAGVLAALCGGSPVLGFHLLRLIALAALLFGARRLLIQGGLSGRALAWALVLLATGGGLGWLRVSMGAPGSDVPDVLTGLYPWHQALMSAHFVWSMALLLWCASWYMDYRAGRAPRWRWVAGGAVLGLSRPYDLVVLIGLVGLMAVLDLASAERRAGAWVRLLDPVWLTPAAAYYALLVTGLFGPQDWAGDKHYRVTPALEFLPALLPAGLAAAIFWRRPASSAPAADVRRLLACWVLMLLALVLAHQSALARQHMISLGAATLLAAALVTPARGLPVLCALCCATSLFVWWQTMRPNPAWFLPRDYFTAQRDLAAACRTHDVLVAPTDLSLMVAGLTPCSVALGHVSLTPNWSVAIAEGQRFYDPAESTTWRRAYLDALRARFVALPTGGGQWLAGSPFRLRLATPLLEVWERAPSEGSGTIAR